MDIKDKRQLSDAEATDLIKNVCKVINVSDIKNLDKTTRNEYLRQLKKEYHLSIRQIERLTGINRGVVLNA
ncbi:hypothetical protein [Syntrophomonas wolfei]|uniref:hypothetical protein n=1 Tax=Syntrophomonas wolfei TaxID=863 RepID=UPI000773FE39|nr:hypothetical protein [Syntrophomonas wolfei]